MHRTIDILWMDSEINRLVYGLHGLGEEEIGIIEGRK